MLWVLKRTDSMRRFVLVPKHMLKLVAKKIITFLCSKSFLGGTYEEKISEHHDVTEKS